MELVSALILVKGLSVLLLQRGPDMSYPNLWCFPGGKIKDEESPREAAVREVKEEIGYDISIHDVSRICERYHDNKHVHYYITSVDDINCNMRLEPGFVHYEWFNLSRFTKELDNQLVPMTREALQDSMFYKVRKRMHNLA